MLIAILFDDKRTREETKKIDKLAAIRFIMDYFVDNSKECYTICESVTIERMLIAFRGRCSFVYFLITV